ncbi:hypothetical protein [Bacillus haynesii]|uniref:hypothetical protein n=1 Tax=Bacillus haynesii TaxID=1925021 RepID=UPI00227DF3FC|nr:hypothetical protein [Bacillus haynesii]MCY9274592.1 hypothetical protein [Bacillus haynesii]
MAKYRKKPVEVEAKLFEMGMEDGYACYPLFSNKFLGFYPKNGYLPKAGRKPAIKTLEGWYEVEVGKHYIVTGVKGERYPVEKEIFEETYEKINE